MTRFITDPTAPALVPPTAGLPARIVRRVLARGLSDTLRRTGFLAYESYREWRLGIDTAGFIDWHQLGSNPESVDYDPIGYRTLDRALRQVTLRPGDDVFLEYGCGKGRPVVAAATRPFAKVIGVEMSEPLCEIARENVRRTAARRRCGEVHIVQSAAEQYSIPDDVSVIFMFNPFTGHTLETVVQRIHQSLARRPRQLTILYVIPLHSRDRFRDCDWLRRKHDRRSQGLRLVVYESTAGGQAQRHLQPGNRSCTSRPFLPGS